MRNAIPLQDRLLVSGPNGGGLALLSRNSAEILSSRNVTGIALSDGSVAWALQDEPGLLRLFRDGVLQEVRVSDAALDLHDLLIEGNSIWAVATESNALLHLDSQGGESERIVFSSVPDSWHVNSVARHEGRLLVSAFGRFASHRGYKGNTRGQGEILDAATGQTVIPGLSQPHSLLSVGRELWVCSSEEGEVLAYVDGECVRRLRVHGYARGLAIGRNHLYVGISRPREQSTLDVGRRFESAVIAVYDLQSSDLVGHVALPWNEIYDIRLVESEEVAEELLLSLFAEVRSGEASGIAPVKVAELEGLRSAIAQHHDRFVEALSSDIRRMQEAAAAAHERAGAAEARADISLKIEALAGQIVSLQRSLQEQSQALREAEDRRQAAEERIETLQKGFDRLLQESYVPADLHREAKAECGRLAGEVARSLERLATAEAALADERSASGRLLADLDERNRQIARLTQQEARLSETARQFELLVRSRTWRWTRPVRLFARLLGGRLAPSDIDRVAGLAQRVVARMPLLGAERRGRLMLRLASRRRAAPGALPDQSIASAMPLAKARDLPDVYVWSVIDWHFRVQRPQHLARALAGKGHRVFYISVNFVDSDEPGFHIDALDGCGNLQQIHFNLRGEPLIYSAMPSPEEVRRLQASLGQLLAWTRTRQAISIVQHPYWNQLAWSVPNARVVYDCMDHHAGFENNANVVIEAEEYLVRNADLVVVTSSWLEHEVGKAARYTKIVRNAGEFEFFRDPPREVFSDPQGRQVIGYFGAIADWFDLDLVAAVAMAMPERLVLLVGHDSIDARSALAALPNVQMVGEVPYAKLPYWLHGFDACLLPFKVTALTQATNPVKVYEYLAAGKPVVSVDLPEMAQFGDLVRVGHDTREFVEHARAAIEQPVDEDGRERRQAFAAQQTWGHRAAEFDEAMGASDEALVSVVVLAYNNLEFTRACLSSIELYSDYRNLEVIVVDNASSDGSVEFLRAWVEQPSPAGHRRRLLLNEANLGFAAGNNIGLAAAHGEVLVLLNNDTYVTPGWVRDLRNHLRRDPRIGLVGPVTNNIGNEARIEIAYGDMEQMLERAVQHTLRYPGVTMPMRTLAFFCVAMPRQVYEQVGPLDEAFGQGFFEDDDYCRRVEVAGWKVECAENVFVHHHLSASFDQVKAERRAELFERNKATYEAKWGPWEPHSYRDTGPSDPSD